jgi:hypothetical protein
MRGSEGAFVVWGTMNSEGRRGGIPARNHPCLAGKALLRKGLPPSTNAPWLGRGLGVYCSERDISITPSAAMGYAREQPVQWKALPSRSTVP